MKNFILIFFLVIQSVYSQNNYTELQELGLQGNVESIITKTYFTKIDSTNLISKRIANFNKKGNITKIVDSTYENGKLTVAEKVYFESINGTKSLFKIYLNGELAEYGSYEWINDRNYKIISFGDDSIKSEHIYFLNQNLRDSVGRTKFYLYNPEDYSTVEYLASKEYQNYYDKIGNLKKVIHLDEFENDKREVLYKTLECDNLGNITKVELYDKKSDTLVEIRTSKYIYN